MLDRTEMTNPDAWATHFCEPMSKLRMRPMTGEETKILLQLHMAGDDFKIPADGEKPLALEVLSKRLPLYGFEMTDAAKLFVCALAETPGQIVMYLTYISWRMANSNVRLANIEFLCTTVFPWGIPSETDLHTLWEAQKCGGSNLLDSFAAGESILSKLKTQTA